MPREAHDGVKIDWNFYFAVYDASIEYSEIPSACTYLSRLNMDNWDIGVEKCDVSVTPYTTSTFCPDYRDIKIKLNVWQDDDETNVTHRMELCIE